METILQKPNLQIQLGSLTASISELWEKACTVFWFLLCLSLFIALGPFSAPVALIALYKVAMEDEGSAEPESVS